VGDCNTAGDESDVHCPPTFTAAVPGLAADVRDLLAVSRPFAQTLLKNDVL